MPNAEGYIKFKSKWNKEPVLSKAQIEGINYYRQLLFDKNFIGAYENGIGFGNISQRIPQTNNFIISGSKTGLIQCLNEDHFSLVTECDIAQNTVVCQGLTEASSESLSHFAIYETLTEINAIIHIHDLEKWQELINHQPTTNPSAAYGTPEISYEIIRILKENPHCRTIIMGGHQEGILIFAENLKSAYQNLIGLFDKLGI